jgi:hypothetical protein
MWREDTDLSEAVETVIRNRQKITDLLVHDCKHYIWRQLAGNWNFLFRGKKDTCTAYLKVKNATVSSYNLFEGSSVSHHKYGQFPEILPSDLF